MNPHLRRVLGPALIALVLLASRATMLRYGTEVSGRGDFFATLPGAYAQSLNPALWNSKDLQMAMGFHRPFYIYGPTQYLTLYPMAFLNSYAQIAMALSLIYAGAVAGALWLMSRVIRPEKHELLPGVVALALPFAPLLQAYAHLEFEVIVFGAIVAATYFLVRRRDTWAGALLGYIAWFKIWPVVFLGYFALKRQFKAAGAFVVTSVLTLALSQALFGLDRFIFLNPTLARSLPDRDSLVTTIVPPMQASFDSALGPENATGKGFCKGWVRSDRTYVSVRWGMCGLMYTHHLRAGIAAFYGLGLLAAAFFLVGFIALEKRGDLDPADNTCRIVCEVALAIIGAALTLVAHYYYFIFLLLPICVLAYRFLARSAWVKLAWLTAAYIVLGASVLPGLLVWRWLGGNFWTFYMVHEIYLPGLALLTSLIMWEYLSLGSLPPFARAVDRQPLAAGDSYPVRQ